MLEEEDIFVQTTTCIRDCVGMNCTKVIGLTIQENFIIGRKPTSTVALTCSKFLAPATNKWSVRIHQMDGINTNDCHGCKIDYGMVNQNYIETLYLYSEWAQSTRNQLQ